MISSTKISWARISRVLLPMLLIVSAVSCSHNQIHADGSPGLVMLAEDIGFELLPPAGFGHSLMLTQSAEISFAGETHELIFYTEITIARVVIVGALSTGTRIFTINYDGRTISSEGSDRLYEHLDAEYFLADLQLAQWPIDNLMSSLAAHSPCFTSGECTLSDSAGQHHRTLEHQAMPVLSISYSDSPRYRGTTEIIHHQRDYRLKITTLDVEVL